MKRRIGCHRAPINAQFVEVDWDLPRDRPSFRVVRGRGGDAGRAECADPVVDVGLVALPECQQKHVGLASESAWDVDIGTGE